MKGIEFLKLSENEFGKWNSFVDEHPDGTLFQTTRWLSIINPEVEVIAGIKNGEIAGGVALIKTKKFGLTGYHLPPYSPVVGPLVSSFSITSEFERIQFTQQLLSNIPKSGHIDFVLILKEGIFAYHWSGFSSSVAHNYIIAGDIQDYEKKLNKNKARELKKIRDLVSNGELFLENNVSIDVFMELMKETADRKSFYTRDKVLEHIIKSQEFPNFSASLKNSNGEYLSAVYLVEGKVRLYNLFNVSRKTEHPIYKTSNLLLLDEAIKYALRKGLIFDFEGSMLKGVEHFYRLMGGTIEHKVRLQKTGSLRYSILKFLKEIRNSGINSI